MKGNTGLSELAVQLRSLQSKSKAQKLEIARLEKQIKILSDLQNVSVQDLKSALAHACEAEAHSALRLQIKQLKNQLKSQETQPQTTSAEVASYKTQVASLELQVGEMEELLEAKDQELDRLYQLQAKKNQSKGMSDVWKKRFESLQEQSKLEKSQQQARIWVLEEQQNDLQQQLSSLYAAFEVLQQEQENEVRERQRLESCLQEADAQVAKNVNEGDTNSHLRGVTTQQQQHKPAASTRLQKPAATRQQHQHQHYHQKQQQPQPQPQPQPNRYTAQQQGVAQSQSSIPSLGAATRASGEQSQYMDSQQQRLIELQRQHQLSLQQRQMDQSQTQPSIRGQSLRQGSSTEDGDQQWQRLIDFQQQQEQQQRLQHQSAATNSPSLHRSQSQPAPFSQALSESPRSTKKGILLKNPFRRRSVADKTTSSPTKVSMVLTPDIGSCPKVTKEPSNKGVKCKGCNKSFPSRNALFKHLKEKGGACLPTEEASAFRKQMLLEREGTLLLFGYCPSKMGDITAPVLKNGSDAADLLLDIIMLNAVASAGIDAKEQEKFCQRPKYNRSYGIYSRSTSLVAQDNYTGALTELISTKLCPISSSMNIQDWITCINVALSDSLGRSSALIRLLGRQKIPSNKFNAELDFSHRRLEYIMPLDMLYNPENPHCAWATSLESFAKSFPAFSNRFSSEEDLEESPMEIPNKEALRYMKKMKVSMQLLTCSQERQGESSREEVEQASLPNGDERKSKVVVKRRRYHNFTPFVMAHEFLSYRKLNRLYHRATLCSTVEDAASRPSTVPKRDKTFIVLSLSGDLFLAGQVSRVVGLFIAIIRGVIDPEIVDCVFDENYPHLVPTPPAPPLGIYASIAFYGTWEGKAQSILTPRASDRYSQGWNDSFTLKLVDDWQDTLRSQLMERWAEEGTTSNSSADEESFALEKEWIEGVLMPWSLQAKEQLAEYRSWKEKQSLGKRAQTIHPASGQVSLPEASVPSVYQKVLYLLQQADQSGLWPSTTPKRQLVMVSNHLTDDKASHHKSSSLASAQLQAKFNKNERSSAYEFEEGFGGASGSFSVGAMPGEQCVQQPKGNQLFPELTKAAFELEIALFPNRPPSSTIAINRNAQFRPHIDAGSGSGQSLSLIVALGCFSGGQLVVEGEKRDIRYRPIEFNGWTQRHWTMPFTGERYSLVWFTPKGCEGIRGIDLCK